MIGAATHRISQLAGPSHYSAFMPSINYMRGSLPRVGISSSSLAMFAAIAAPKCCGFLATLTNISRFYVATGLTNLGSEVEHN
jgi:hypothetical protein